MDLKESTRRAVKYRRGGDIIIVIHDGRGWFDPLGEAEAKGDVFSLVEHLAGVGFAEGLNHVAGLVGYEPAKPAWTRPLREAQADRLVPDRWQARRRPWPGSLTWRYLTGERALSGNTLRDGIRQERIREGPNGSMWAAHSNDNGFVTGWEERGPQWRGFASGGAKVLFRLGQLDARRICVAEAAIDAMSLAEIEGPRDDSLYLSTGGGWAPATEAAIRALAERPNALLVAATDNNQQGAAYARRLASIAVETGCGYERLQPTAGDWNEDLKAMKERRNEEDLPHAQRPRQG
ncbi:DUF3991 and toprim domain-containing protein [Rhizobium sp. NPDC090275]|uniref:DUF3991 and toprim domain-containing protein n=1 Tax=Rhizobium sp. NPDC090275 TaxID=3364498 RepID=UPI00383AFA70